MTWKEKQKYIKKRNKEMKKVKHLGIDKIIIVDPAYALRNSSQQKKLVKSEEKEITNNKILTNAAQKNGLETVLLCKEEYNSNSTDLFNDEAAIKEWIGEYSYYTDFKMLPMTGDRMAKIANKYNSEYILISGIDASKYKREKRGQSILFAFVIYPAAPYYLYKAFSYSHQNSYYNFLIDTKTGKLVLTDLRETAQKEKEFNSRSIIYDVMYQINSKK